MRRLPPQQIEKNLSDLIDLVCALFIWFHLGLGICGCLCVPYPVQNSDHTRRLLSLQPDTTPGLRDSSRQEMSSLWFSFSHSFSATCVKKAQDRSSRVGAACPLPPAALFSLSRGFPSGTGMKRPHIQQAGGRAWFQVLLVSAIVDVSPSKRCTDLPSQMLQRLCF